MGNYNWELARSYSPLQIFSGRAVRSLQNDWILPNPYRLRAVATRLRGGRDILFLPAELRNYARDRSASAAFFVQFQSQLQEKGLGLLVLLVPDKYVVYHDLLEQAPPGAERQPFLNIVEQRLVAAHVPVVNLTTRFRDRAEALLARDEYLYWLDDTHWNGAGIQVAAQAIAESQAVLECRCQ